MRFSEKKSNFAGMKEEIDIRIQELERKVDSHRKCIYMICAAIIIHLFLSYFC